MLLKNKTIYVYNYIHTQIIKIALRDGEQGAITIPTSILMKLSDWEDTVRERKSPRRRQLQQRLRRAPPPVRKGPM
jgi:hypothetical protein